MVLQLQLQVLRLLPACSVTTTLQEDRLRHQQLEVSSAAEVQKGLARSLPLQLVVVFLAVQLRLLRLAVSLARSLHLDLPHLNQSHRQRRCLASNLLEVVAACSVPNLQHQHRLQEDCSDRNLQLALLPLLHRAVDCLELNLLLPHQLHHRP